MDYRTVAEDYLNDEAEYKLYISDILDNDTRALLRLTDANGARVSSAVLVMKDDEYVLYEVKRVGIPVNNDVDTVVYGDVKIMKQRFETILDWWNDVVQNLEYPIDKYDDEIDCMFSHILVGKTQKMPLWDVIKNIQHDRMFDDLLHHAEEMEKDRLKEYVVQTLLFLLIIIQFVCLCFYLTGVLSV